MKIYIAGKITGLVYEEALRKFCRVEQMLEQQGHEPVNPMRANGLDGGVAVHSWEDYMRRDIPLLLECDAIYLLKDWVGSKGARLEQHIATAMGMKLFYDDLCGQTQCTAAGCKIWFIQTDPDAEVDLCHLCESAVIRAGMAN